MFLAVLKGVAFLHPLCSLHAGRYSAPLQYLLSVPRGSVAFLPECGAGIVREFRGFRHDLRLRSKTPS